MTIRGVSLDAVLRAVGGAFVELVLAPVDQEIFVDAVVLMETSDIECPRRRAGESSELWLTVAVGATELAAWLNKLDQSGKPPRVVMSKVAADESVQVAARRAGTALIAVHPGSAWDRLFTTIQGMLDHSVSRQDSSSDVFGSGTDLFELAQNVAALTRGMVSIEDERSHILAYSASDDAADELRKRSILGREGPREYLRKLQEWGVFEGLRRSDDVIEVPADDELAMRRRLVVPIRRFTENMPGANNFGADLLGTIWVQEGQRPIAGDAGNVLCGAAAVAARLISRIRDAPSNEAIQIQRLLGLRGGGVDIPSLAAALTIPVSGPALVIGVAGIGDGGLRPLGELASSLRLHASAFHRESLVTAVGARIYVLFPRTQSVKATVSWTREVIVRLGKVSQSGLRAALSSPVATLADVAQARAEVDRVLDGTTGDVRVTTLADSRTPVLLGEIVGRIAEDERLHDPRIGALDAYDKRNASNMRESVSVYLRHSGDVRRASQHLKIHPNTLRYRIKRVEEITDIDLSDPAARLLMEIQLAVSARSTGKSFVT
ncbi:PucR family transcriptional regulator [Rhodococcus globerulus]|uniref:Helix-turn-helix domain-containing protein n=1 Tax=Rhodococcus globerulus TaxID=33008 RepID=A0ABU4C424_RHOGO|nr:helix-turn-helix domain-containing protein [Rhodococcus globerulus]MDV6271044.1 helix-turn-helix domain-containing protein [Rhodococcus globerulus]